MMGGDREEVCWRSGENLPTVYFLGVRIDGSERTGALWETNSKSMSVNVLTSWLYNFCTAPMQSIELDPVPIHVKLSVHWLLLPAKMFVMLAWGRIIAAADAMLQNVEKMTRKEISFGDEEKYADVIVWERFWSGSQLEK